MQAADAFQNLVRRLRQGDEEAAHELVQRYEPEIRRSIRVRLTDPVLKRTLDSMDICQSVLANFFVRVRCGQFDLQNPRQLLALLLTMASNKIIDQARRAGARGRGKLLQGETGEEVLAAARDHRETPSQQVGARELAAEARRRLSSDERQLADLRADGKEWAEIAALLGGTSEARRKQFERAINRVACELGIDESHEDARAE